MTQLNRDDYIVMAQANTDSAGNVAEVLNRNGLAGWTICPECGVDDFIHIGGCPINDELNGDGDGT